MKQFEYKFMKLDSWGITLEQELNALGQEGWEAVGIAPYYTDGSTISQKTQSYAILLKRLIEDEDEY